MQREQVHLVVDRLFDLGEALACKRAPREAGLHFASARREVLLGVRALVDAALAGQETTGAAAEGARPITVEE